MAQDIDIENMDDAELLALLQTIMQKLEQGGSAEPAAEGPASASSAIPEAKPDLSGFEIYENKKLTIEKLPDYMFIQKPTGGDNESSQERDKVREILQVVFDNDYQGVQSMLGFTSVDDLYDAWKDSDTNWDQYGDQVNEWLNKH